MSAELGRARDILGGEGPLLKQLEEVMNERCDAVDALEAAEAELKLKRTQFSLATDWMTRCTEAEKALTELRRVQEQRFDCRGGPGHTKPACGACTTCLLAEIERLKA